MLDRQLPDTVDLAIHPIAACIGAQIDNIKLTDRLPDPAVDAIKSALVRHKVLFFRKQDHLDDAGQEAFTARLGELARPPAYRPRSGTFGILDLDSHEGRRADRWHSDGTFVAAYPKISVLRSVVIPASGGDTVWANTVAAYESLPPALKEFAGKLWAVHSNLYDYAAVRPDASQTQRTQYEDVFTSTVHETEHPVVRVIEDTGERSLLLGYFVRRFAGYSQSESNHLFDLLQDRITRLENTIRWRWSAGDVAIWDNRTTQHCAVNDYGDQRRIVRRSNVKGDAPVSVDGRISVTRPTRGR